VEGDHSTHRADSASFHATACNASSLTFGQLLLIPMAMTRLAGSPS
jgi:hypothetical protein